MKYRDAVGRRQARHLVGSRESLLSLLFALQWRNSLFIKDPGRSNDIEKQFNVLVSAIFGYYFCEANFISKSERAEPLPGNVFDAC